MYDFPARLYTDVRVEEVFESEIEYTYDNLDQARERRYVAAFVRVFDGQRWYYSATTDPTAVQSEINRLAGFASPSDSVESNATIARLSAHEESVDAFSHARVDAIDLAEKDALLHAHFAAFNGDDIASWSPFYRDAYVRKSFYSSKGARLEWDYQKAGFGIGFDLASGEKQFSEAYQFADLQFPSLSGHESESAQFLAKARAFLAAAEPLGDTTLPMVLSPMVAGVFAHESFGHKSEADFMVGDENMRREWSIGRTVGSPILSIVDDGGAHSVGFTPFDDEGTPANKTYLIKDGKLAGRLHSCATAADLSEEPTGNARAVSFEYQPIVRMTTTYIEPGSQSKDELIAGVEDGLLVEDLKHGSGMSTFTIAPTFAYRIRDGEVAEPVQVSVISGNVFEALGKIDGLSDELTLLSFVRGGCGKAEQFPLPVGFGGPWVRISELSAQ